MTKAIREKLKTIKTVRMAYFALKYGQLQWKITIQNQKDRQNPIKPDGFPLPPARLRYRVHGALDPESFVETGRIVANDIRSLCAGANFELKNFEKVLDFGCGSGRVIRNLFKDLCHGELHATDIDEEMINWCKTNLPAINWHINGFHPPLPYEDATFDFVYAISVFTHLDESYQDEWLAELQRITQPGALLLLTVHGESVFGRLPEVHLKELGRRGILFATKTTGRFKLDQLPDFYQTAFHTRDYIVRHWARWFDLVEYIPQGINNHQDAVLLRRKLPSLS